MQDYKKYLIRIIFFLALISIFIFYNYAKLETGFFHNAGLNSVIIIIFIIGSFFSVRSILLLKKDGFLLNEIIVNRTTSSSAKPKFILDIIDNLKIKNDVNKYFNWKKNIEEVAFKFESEREINKYLIAVLVILGLLGTFWGLLSTINSVGETISNLNVEESDVLSTFMALKEGIKNPMSGMGTAFSSSLFGLSGSLCLGFLDLQLSRAQNDFLDNLNRNLKNVNNDFESDDPRSSSIYLEALIGQTIEGLNKMSELFDKNENSRKSLEDIFAKSINVLSKINDEIDLRLNQSNQTAISILEHIRNIDNSLLELKEQIKNNNSEFSEELSKEIKLLTKTIALIKK